jgi:hypothetical protein
MGAKDYSVGNHPLWEAFRMMYQMTKPPVFFGGLALGWGYASALLARRERAVSPELVAFVRREQMQRLKKLFTRKSSPALAQAHVQQRGVL